MYGIALVQNVGYPFITSGSWLLAYMVLLTLMKNAKTLNTLKCSSNTIHSVDFLIVTPVTYVPLHIFYSIKKKQYNIIIWLLASNILCMNQFVSSITIHYPQRCIMCHKMYKIDDSIYFVILYKIHS